MKKQLAYILTAVLILTSFTACNDDQTVIQGSSNSGIANYESQTESLIKSHSNSTENAVPEEKKLGNGIFGAV